MPPTNLIEALTLWANEQDAFAIFAGGIWDTDAPTGTSTPLPYLTFVQGDSRQQNIIGGGRWVQWMTVNLEARATLAADARSLGTMVRDQIVPAGDPQSALAWMGGHEVGRYLTDGEGGELEDGMGPDGSDVWVHRIPIVFTTARG